MAKGSDNVIPNLNVDWGLDESTGRPYSGKAVQEFIKKQLIDQQTNTENKYGYVIFEDGALKFYANQGDSTPLSTIQFSGTNYIIDFGTAKNITVLTSDESYLLDITPKTYAVELGSTNREDFVEDYTFKLEVDTGKGFVDQNVLDNKIKFGQTKYTDIRKNLVVGVNRIRVTVTGVQSEQSKSIVYNVTLTSLTLTCNHSWNNVWFGGQNYRITNIYFSGNVKKDLCLEINGVLYKQQFTTNAEYKSVPYEFDVTDKFETLETGIIPIKVWIESDNVRTKEYQFNIMYVAPGDEDAQLICLNNIPDEVYNFEQSNLFMYALYNLSEVTISIKQDINGILSQIGEPKTLINLQQQYRYSEKISLNINTELTNGIYVVFDINGIEGRIPLNNSKAYLATEGHVFYMNPSLRSNNTDDKKQWYNSSDNSKINAEWDNFTFSDDGWTLDQNGNSALVVKAGSNVIVHNFKPFKPTDSQNSKTFEFMFKSANIADYNTPIFQAISTDSFDINNKNCVGLVLYPTRLLIVTNNERQELFQQLPLSENRIIHVAIVVQREYASNSATNLIRIFINGCENVTFSIQNSSSLYLESDYNYLKIGQPSSDFYLYLLRQYNKALSGGQILANYLNALIESTEVSRQGIRHDNDILDGGSISYDICKQAGYNTMVIETDKDIPSLKNSNTENLRVNILLEYNDHPEWNVKINNTPLDGQGTTSSKYAKWNLRSKVDKNAIWEYADGTKTTGKEGYIAGPDNPKSSKITWKKNIASQPQGHKMGATSFYNDLFKKVLGDVYIQENFPSENVRVAVYQYPFMGFQKFSDGTYKFIGLYTGGPDKTDKKTFGYNETDTYPKLMMIEGPNHKPLLTRFLTPWTDDVFYDQSQETLSIGDPNGEKEEGWDADIAGDFDTEEDNILPLYESEFKPAYDAIFYNSVYIASLKEANAENIFDDSFDVLTFRDKTTTVPLPDGTTKTFSNELMTFYDNNYKLIYYDVKTKKYKTLNSHNLLDYLKLSGTPSTLDIITARLNQWQEKVGQYVSLYEAYYHTCFCELIGASDNDAKNTYWRKFKSLEDGGLWGFQQDDLDTIFQNDNNGQDTKNYYAEHNDVNANGGDIFQGRTSAFWTTLRIVCKNEIQNTMNKLVEKALELAEQLNLTKSTQHETMFNLIKYYFWDHSSKYFSATAYNEDTQWAYIDVWYENPSATYNSVPPLTQIHGDHFETEYDWVEKRIAYMFSKYQIGAYKAGNEDGYGSLDFTCGEAFTLNIVPAIAQYPRISKGGESTQSISARTLEGETFQIAVEASKDTGTYIKGMHWISDLGDLSGLKLNSRGGTTEIVFTVNSKRLRRLILGNDETPKFNATNILLTCEGLEVLNAKNVDDLNTVVDLSQCPRIKEIDLTGTHVPQVILPEGGRVEKLHLPGTLNTLILNDLQLLNDLYIEDYSTIQKIYCHSNNAVDILQNILNLETNNITHIGLKWDDIITISDSKFLSMLANLTAKKENGDYVYSSAKIDEKGTLKTDDTFKTPPFIQGRIYTDIYVYLSEVEAITNNLDIQIEYNPAKVYVEFVDKQWQKLVSRTPAEGGYGDGIGITQEQLSTVTKIPANFANNSGVTNLIDFDLFENIKTIDGSAFSNCNIVNFTLKPINDINVGNLFSNNTTFIENMYIKDAPGYINKNNENYNTVTKVNNMYFDSIYGYLQHRNAYHLNVRGTWLSAFANNCFIENKKVGEELRTIIIPEDFKGNLYILNVNLDEVIYLPTNNVGFICFSNSRIKKFKCPDQFTHLGEYGGIELPDNGSLKQLDLNNINKIQHYFFRSSSLEELWVKSADTWLNTIIPDGFYFPPFSTKTKVYIGSMSDKSISLTDVMLNDAFKKIDKIGYRQFCNFATLEGNLIIPDNITSIGTQVFYNCQNLKTIDLGKNISKIPAQAFQTCKSLTDINIQGNITEIDSNSFQNCSSLVNINIPNTCLKFGNNVFASCTSLKQLNIPDNATLNGWFCPSAKIQYFKIGKNITLTHDYDLGNIGSIENLEISDDIENWCKINWEIQAYNPLFVANHVYMKEQLLTDLIIPNEVTEIPRYAFKRISDLKSITFPNTLTTIRRDAFRDCANLQGVLNIPESVTTIENCAFYNTYMTGDNNILILHNKNITLYEADIFATVCKFKSVYLDDIQSLYETPYTFTFGNGTIPSDIYVDEKLIEDVIIKAPKDAIGINDSLRGTTIKSVKFEEGITSILSNAFNGCNKLIKVDLPSTIADVQGMPETIKITIIRNNTPISYNSTLLANNKYLFVPDNAINIYRSTSGWSNYINRIYPLSCIFEEKTLNNDIIWTDLKFSNYGVKTTNVGTTFTKILNSNNNHKHIIIDLDEDIDFVQVEGFMINSEYRPWCLIDSENNVIKISDQVCYMNGLIPITVNGIKMSKLIINVDISIYNRISVKVGKIEG